jgi:hypothetical protein
MGFTDKHPAVCINLLNCQDDKSSLLLQKWDLLHRLQFVSFLFHQCLTFQQVPQHSKPFSHICSAAARKKGRKEGRKVFLCAKGGKGLTWRRGGLEHELYSQISIISFTSNSKQSIASLQHRRNPGTTKPRKAVRYIHPH